MLTWLKAITSLGAIASFLKGLMVPLIYLFARWKAFQEQWEVNEKLREAYDKVEAKEITDEDIDKRLDDGTI